VPTEGKALADGRLAVACLVALGRIGPAASQATLNSIRDAYIHTPLHVRQYSHGNDVRLAAAIAVLQIDGRGRDDDVVTVVESLRLVKPDIAPELAEALAAVARKHADIVPRLRQLLAIAHWQFVASQPERWSFAATDEYEARGIRFLTLAKCVAAASPESELLRPMVREALAWDMAQFAYRPETRVGLIELLIQLNDRSAEFRALAKQAADESYWLAVRHAADEALRQIAD
jgi:hypothetical protein